MDLTAKIIAQEQRAAEDRLKADREARKESLQHLKTVGGPMRRPPQRRLTEAVYVPTADDTIRQVMRDESELGEVKPRKPGWLRRLFSWARHKVYHAPADHTHRIIARCELKQYHRMPRNIDDLYEEDEKGKPIKNPPFTKVTIERGVTGRLCKVLFAGVLVLETDEDTYIVAGWEHVEKL